ncbi:unnamed protein product [Somion occarium]|uniref:Autophagy-related protein 11 n=1 Tax=Somion occarium TaxID=3059160 RepID=A0ABP1CXU1_9APHY
MIQICRAEDGRVFQVNASLSEIEKVGSLEQFLSKETGIDHDSILAYLSDGTRLRNDNVRELAGVQDQTIYMFNKTYLDYDIEHVLERLRVEPPVEPPIEEILSNTASSSQLSATYIRTAHVHSDELERTLSSLRYQNEALRIASSALDLHVLAIADAFDGIAAGAQRELVKQASLLAGVEADLEIISRVAIHKEFVSLSVKKAMEAGEKGRSLGDYVSKVKMRQVAEACQKTHDDLTERFNQAQTSMDELRHGADDVRSTVSDDSLLKEAELCVQRSKGLVDQITDAVASLERTTPSNSKLQELQQLDASLRAEVVHVTDIKNHLTERCINALRHISILNNYIVELPLILSELHASFRAKTSFSHIQRLHNMLYAYGATVVEIVRRKEFAQFFYQRAQGILEVMAKLSANERKRRQLYRGEVHGQLPFETKGMDDPVPSIDFSPSGSSESPYSLERGDVDSLMKVLQDLEHFAEVSLDPVAKTSVRDARIGLEKLIGKMDSLESGFDRIAERSLLSSSRWLNHRRRNNEADEQAYAELEAHIAELNHAKSEQEEAFQRERRDFEREITELKAQLKASDSGRNALERDLHSYKAHLESETTSRRILEQRNAELSSGADNQRSSLATALAEATERTKAAEVLRQELAQVRSEFEEVKSLESRNATKVANLLEEQANALRRLDEARSRGEDLQQQIQQARLESDELQHALADTSKEKDRLLKAQASEHDRLLRDHIAEADGDRAVLEHQYLELQAALEGAERQLKDIRAQLDMTNSDAMGLREELQRVEHELREARHVERILTEDLGAGKASQSDFELQLENSNRLIAQILDVALRFRESHLKALAAASAMTTHPGSSKGVSSTSLTESSFGALRRGVTNHLDEPSPIDPSDPAAALEILRTFDHDQFLEAIHKTGSTIRKWQKQCKEYRERAKGKISFRNFAKGDLALFLPTRNSVSKPWAAFNVSFPHYFLQATGHLAEQLKTREWIVARITSITERVVDAKDASTNPYGLGDGVKYYMLEVEDWTQPTHHSSKRRSSNKKTTPDTSVPPIEVPPEPLTAPPEAEVEDSFTVTRPPNSRLFPSSPRTNSIPTAGPSSLSRLLAQAEAQADAVALKAPEESQTPPSLTYSPQLQPQVSPARSTPTPTPQGAAGTSGPSTLRPGSRASRQSTSSRFPTSRIPFAGSSGVAKATATTALSDQVLSNSPSSGGSMYSPSGAQSPGTSSFSPSPEGSPTRGMSNILNNRRRAASHTFPRNSSLAAAFPTTSGTSGAVAGSPPGPGLPSGITARSRLASLASSWGVPFARKRLSDVPQSPSPIRSANGSDDDNIQSPS